MQLVYPPKIKRSVLIPAVLLLSTAVHGVVLWSPLSPLNSETSSLPTAETAETDDISVIVLPKDEAAEPPPAPPEARESPSESSALLPTDVIPAANPPAAPLAPAPEPPISPLETQPAEPEPSTPIDEPPVEEGSSSPAFSSPVNEGPLLGYGNEFPHVAGAVGGCFGLSECRQVSGVGTYRSVARSLTAGLANNGYTVKLRDDLEDTGRNVYELIPPGNDVEKQFLMVFSGDDGSAIYVMSPDIMTLDELKAIAAQAERDRPAA